MVAVLAGPAVFILVQSLHWVLRLIIAVVFMVCAFIFPWFYDRFPVFYWLTILLAYAEIFWLIPILLKRREYLKGKP